VATGKRDTQYKWQILCPERRPEDRRAIIHTIKVNDHILDQEEQP
jgi:hypothetical protein